MISECIEKQERKALCVNFEEKPPDFHWCNKKRRLQSRYTMRFEEQKEDEYAEIERKA